eukprot:989816-Amphidinium_carterae.1
MTQPQQQRLESINIYDQQPYRIHNITGSTRIVDKDNATTDQLRRWAILIDTSAMTSVASQEHFTHIPIKPLRQQDPQTLTAMNGENINIYGIKK